MNIWFDFFWPLSEYLRNEFTTQRVYNIKNCQFDTSLIFLPNLANIALKRRNDC